MNISVSNIRRIRVPGLTINTANDINNHGQIVGQCTDANGVVHGFVYNDGVLCQVDYPGGRNTNVIGINNLGQMVGMFGTLTGTFGFVYDRGTFGQLAFPGAGNLTIANGINDRGEIVGVFQDTSGVGHGFLYKAAQYQPLQVPGAKETTVEAINASGQIVGNYPDTKGTHGFVYLENAGVFFMPVDCPNTKVTALRAINNEGQIAGGCIDPAGNEHPFLYIAGGLSPMLIPGAVSVSVNGINDHGKMVGNIRLGIGPAEAFVGTILC